jgi:hypothetical protein
MGGKNTIKKIFLRLTIIILFVPLTLLLPLQFIYFCLRYAVCGNFDCDDPLPILFTEWLTEKYDL